MGDGTEQAEGGQEAICVCTICVHNMFLCAYIYIYIYAQINTGLYERQTSSEGVITAVIGRNFLFLCLNMKEKTVYIIVSCHVVQDASTQVKGKRMHEFG